MDLILCAGLAATESFLANKVSGRDASPVSSLTALVLFSVQYLAVKYYRIFLYHEYFSPLRAVPGPKHNQALNLLRAETPTTLYVKWMREHPEAPFIRYLTWANTEVLVPNSLNAHREVLQFQCYSLSKSNWFLRIVKEVAGHGLILMEGDEHRAHRKMLGGSFSLKNIRKLEPIFQGKARDLCRYFDERIRENNGTTGVIDCTTTFSKAILDIMGSAILGVSLDYVKPDDTGAEKSVQAQKNDFNKGFTFYEAYEVFFSPNTVGKILLFANGFLPTRWLPLQANREFLSAMNWLNDVLRNLIRDRYRDVSKAVAAGKYEAKDSRDLVTFIVEESLPGGIAEGIGEDEFLGHLLEFMAAGHDTSANMLSWSLYILATKHDIQEKLRAEVNVLPPNPSYTELDKLPYLENFCKETLRVYSPATTYHREANIDLVIEGVRIPKKTLVDLCPSVTLLNPAIWGDDVDEFDPTRWDRLTGEQLSPYAFSPFSNGPRICIGRQFALFEIKTILAEIVRNYRFVSVDQDFTVENPSFTLRPHGLKVRFEKIIK
ncbi:cytochrome P450 [Hypoxylon sp. NC1633]|nr:cytochrome P450 [Hypoxylon sp. NC1633]